MKNGSNDTMAPTDYQVHPASFRDPSGFVFERSGSIFRQVNRVYQEHYEQLITSGLYQDLVRDDLLVSHEEADLSLARNEQAYKILKPERIPFLSYPYEWCFGQLKSAALTTLRIQKIAMKRRMVLKDSSAYNLQFVGGKPKWIDTLSFEIYREGEPWVAYRQFCQNFLAPLALMSRRDVRLNQLLRIHIDGIPLDLAAGLLPATSYFRPSILTHIHLHAKSQKHYADKPVRQRIRPMSRFRFLALMDHLESSIRSLRWNPGGSEWGNYYECTSYSARALEHKRELVARFLDIAAPSLVWDLGSNTGIFSRLASDRGILTISFDSDPVAVEKNYREQTRKKEIHILPLLLDLTNPSPGIGFQHKERMSLEERGPADTLLSLALIHHLAISHNVPLPKIAEYLSTLCRSLIIEFVPKHDSQVQRLLATRKDIFPDYNRQNFESAFRAFFQIRHSETIRESERTMYLMSRG